MIFDLQFLTGMALNDSTTLPVTSMQTMAGGRRHMMAALQKKEKKHHGKDLRRNSLISHPANSWKISLNLINLWFFAQVHMRFFGFTRIPHFNFSRSPIFNMSLVTMGFRSWKSPRVQVLGLLLLACVANQACWESQVQLWFCSTKRSSCQLLYTDDKRINRFLKFHSMDLRFLAFHLRTPWKEKQQARQQSFRCFNMIAYPKKIIIGYLTSNGEVEPCHSTWWISVIQRRCITWWAGNGQFIATEHTTDFSQKVAVWKGNSLISGKSRLVTYYNLARLMMGWWQWWVGPLAVKGGIFCTVLRWVMWTYLGSAGGLKGSTQRLNMKVSFFGTCGSKSTKFLKFSVGRSSYESGGVVGVQVEVCPESLIWYTLKTWTWKLQMFVKILVMDVDGTNPTCQLVRSVTHYFF